MKLEEMAAFFEARIDGYDEHMLMEVEGCSECYALMATLVPKNAKTLLDLGCGTGLELEGIYLRLPDISVTGIDMSRAMLSRLEQKFAEHAPRLICGDYTETELGVACFDAAVSFQTLHHLEPSEKLALYRRIFAALKPNGVYIECDYMAEDEETETELFAEARRLREEQRADSSLRFHFDTPCSVEHQLSLLSEAGFLPSLEARIENTTLIVARRGLRP